MAHLENNENLSLEEKKFRQLMGMGDDFIKIEIFRNAIKWYREAAKLRPDDPVAKQKIAECEKLLNRENRAIYIIAGIAVVVVALIWLIK
jgi:ERCC4-related helicase